MFHFPRFAPSDLCIQSEVRRHYPPWVSPFGHPRIKAWLAAPRGFSQLPTSFFASCRLGIHRVPFVAWSSLFHWEHHQSGVHWGHHPVRCPLGTPSSQVSSGDTIPYPKNKSLRMDF